ncbi:sodium-coupled monocarboxylate transporter 1 isoform X2 [Ctenocephalides felis]|nr:sodium-coupled monocarboxylate transporter 1 isoform X2 [Ctenocephalides felis]
MDDSSPDFHFTTIDYCVFGLALFVSALTGLYYGCRKSGDESDENNQQNSNKRTEEFLNGNSNFRPLPVAASLVASYVSGVTILGTPSEIFRYGTQYWIIVVPIALMSLVVANVFLPMFCKLQVQSSYEYLEMRFNPFVRTIASVMFVIDELLFLPIVIYVPALAFNQVTGVDVHVIATIVCVVCIFYTVMGGLKAVVWSDTWQTLIMFVSVLFVCILGSIHLGGFSEVFAKADKGDRLQIFNFDPSPYERHTFWSVIIGGFFYWTSFNSVNQTMVQRYMSLPTLRHSKISVYLFAFGIAILISLCCYTGLLVFAELGSCDPLGSGLVKADDQMLPVYVMQVTKNIPGAAGLFVAGVFGAALSSLSVILHCTSGVLLRDLSRGCCGLLARNVASTSTNSLSASRRKHNDMLGVTALRACACFLGAAAVASVYLVEHLGGVLSLASTLSSIAAGTTFGLFALGALVPWSNPCGAITGSVAGALMSAWVAFGSRAKLAEGLVKEKWLRTSLDGCDGLLGNGTAEWLKLTSNMDQLQIDESDVFFLYRLSYHWVSPIGILTVLIVGLIVSLITGKQDVGRMDPELISPVLHRFLPESCKQFAGRTRKSRMKRKFDVIAESSELQLINGDKVTFLLKTSQGTETNPEVR